MGIETSIFMYELWKVQDNRIRLQLDSEYYQKWVSVESAQSRFISLQVATMDRIKPHVAIFEHPDWRIDHPGWTSKYKTWMYGHNRDKTALPLYLNDLFGEDDRFCEVGWDFDHYNRLKSRYKKIYNWRIELNVFYTYADVVAMFGRDFAEYIAEHLVPCKRLKTKVLWLRLPLFIKDLRYSKLAQVFIKIVDWYGLEYTSLEKTCDRFNISMPYKHAMDLFKKNMDIAYKYDKIRESFKEYSIGDLVLNKFKESHVKEFKELCHNLKLKNSVGIEEVPITKGSLVAKLFEMFLHQRVPADKDLLRQLDVPVRKGKKEVSISPAAFIWMSKVSQ